MAPNKTPPTASDEQVRALLQRHQCSIPFHAVRTRLLGDVASLDPGASPINAIEALWGGDLPVFDSEAEANELIGALAMSLWNRLSQHQDRSAPFRLTRMEVPQTRDGLARLARVRIEEIDGFRDGLFGATESPRSAGAGTPGHACSGGNACRAGPRAGGRDQSGQGRSRRRNSDIAPAVPGNHPDRGGRNARSGAVMHPRPAEQDAPVSGARRGHALMIGSGS
jgi:hypothetical protein